VDVVGDIVAGAASHYCFDHTPFGGIVIPTLRRAVSRTPKGAVLSGPTGVLLGSLQAVASSEAGVRRVQESPRPPYSGNYDALRFLPRTGLEDRCRPNDFFSSVIA
jgi:hypothetical protein